MINKMKRIPKIAKNNADISENIKIPPALFYAGGCF